MTMRKISPFEPIKHSKVPIQVQVTKLSTRVKRLVKRIRAISAMSSEEKTEYDLEMEKAHLKLN